MEDREKYKEVRDHIKSLNKLKRDYLVYLCKLHEYFDSNNLDGNKEGVIEELSRKILNGKKHSSSNEIISEIDGLLSNCINMSEVEFILNDDIATMFCYLHLMNNKVFGESGELLYFNNRRTMKEKPFRFSTFSSTHEMKSIITMRREFINFINLMECNYRDKHEYLLFLNMQYSEQVKNLDLTWIKKNNKNQIEWIHGYITKPSSKNGETNEFYDHTPIRPKLFETGEYGFIFLPAMLYALPTSISEKKLLLIKMKKAWSQNKYREKIKKEKKVTMNITIDDDAKKDLKEISDFLGIPINSTIEHLIKLGKNRVNEIERELSENRKRLIE
ncbi:hypothetical protein AB8J12_002813 [Vibrio vulnificus]